MSSSIQLPKLQEQDTEFFQRELDSFIPERIFDAHAHLWRQPEVPWVVTNGPDEIGYAEYQELIEQLHRRPTVGAVFIPGISVDDPNHAFRANQWISEQIRKYPLCRGEYLIRPSDDPDIVKQQVHKLGLHGIKCYHTFSKNTNTFESDIPEYLPERIVELANAEGWFITLHIVKSRAIADSSNIRWIRYYCRTYPNMKLILAHSARSFQPAHNLEGLKQLAKIDNLYFDTSANCEAMAHQVILRNMGPRKLLYGSDFPVSYARGRSVAVADSFIWIYEDAPVWREKHFEIAPVLLGLEHLRSIKWACWSERLRDQDIEDIFFNNAANLFQVATLCVT